MECKVAGSNPEDAFAFHLHSQKVIFAQCFELILKALNHCESESIDRPEGKKLNGFTEIPIHRIKNWGKGHPMMIIHQIFNSKLAWYISFGR